MKQAFSKERQNVINEIVAIPQLLDTLQIKGYVVTINTMGTQVKTAEKVVQKKRTTC